MRRASEATILICCDRLVQWKVLCSSPCMRVLSVVADNGLENTPTSPEAHTMWSTHACIEGWHAGQGRLQSQIEEIPHRTKKLPRCLAPRESWAGNLDCDGRIAGRTEL
jgi:hypothetical protein